MKAFVVMPFVAQLDPIYHDIVAPACSKLDIQAIRADEIFEPGSIPDQLFKSIRESLFVIAEISQQNDNVFYELGYAHAVNKKTILLSDRERKLPFDVSTSRTIIYDRRHENWEDLLAAALTATIRHIYDLSGRLILENLYHGQELEGHMQTISGRLLRVELGQHLWCFCRREDLDTWWPQDDGELRVGRDGHWTGQLWLGREDREVDIDCNYDVKFGLIDTGDSREVTELTIRSKFSERFVGVRALPGSFEELAHVKLRRVRR